MLARIGSARPKANQNGDRPSLTTEKLERGRKPIKSATEASDRASLANYRTRTSEQARIFFIFISASPNIDEVSHNCCKKATISFESAKGTSNTNRLPAEKRIYESASPRTPTISSLCTQWRILLYASKDNSDALEAIHSPSKGVNCSRNPVCIDLNSHPQFHRAS